MSVSAATYLGEVEVKTTNGFPCTLEIYRCNNGMLLGIDSRWKGQVPDPQGALLEPDAITIHCAYDRNNIHILDPEHITRSEGGLAS